MDLGGDGKEEFRRGVKTQASLPDSKAGLKLLFGLFASGQVAMREDRRLTGPARFYRGEAGGDGIAKAA